MAWRAAPRAERRHHEVAVGLVALGVRLDAPLDPAGTRARPCGPSAVIASSATGRLKRSASASGLVGLGVQRGGAAVAVAGGVDHHAPRSSLPRTVDPPGQVLERVDRLAVPADDEAEVLADERPGDHLAVVGDLDLRVEVKGVHDLREQLANPRPGVSAETSAIGAGSCHERQTRGQARPHRAAQEA